MKITLKTDKDTLLKLLKNADINKRLKIFERLDEIPESDRQKILLKILEDGSWFLREKASTELAKSGTKVVPRLVRLCHKGHWFTRAAACRTLGEIADLNALETVVLLLLKDKNPTVIKEARTAFIKIAERNRTRFIEKLKQITVNQEIEEKIEVLIKTIPQEILPHPADSSGTPTNG